VVNSYALRRKETEGLSESITREKERFSGARVHYYENKIVKGTNFVPGEYN